MTRNYTKGIFLGGVFAASTAWAALVLIFLADGWWTWALAGLAWTYAGLTTAHVLRNGVRTPPRKTVMVPTMSTRSPNDSTTRMLT